jgi:hypothetical protein
MRNVRREVFMFASVLSRLFQCAHKHLTRPIAPVRRRGAPRGESYVVCLDCGQRFAYDADQWKIGEALPNHPAESQRFADT